MLKLKHNYLIKLFCIQINSKFCQKWAQNSENCVKMYCHFYLWKINENPILVKFKWIFRLIMVWKPINLHGVGKWKTHFRKRVSQDREKKKNQWIFQLSCENFHFLLFAEKNFFCCCFSHLKKYMNESKINFQFCFALFFLKNWMKL